MATTMPDETDTIDFSSYGGPEITAKVVEIFAVVDRIKVLLFTVFGTLILLEISNYWAHSLHENSLLLWLCTSTYLVITGLVLGVLIGLLVISWKFSGNIIELLRLLLNTVRQATQDHVAMQKGEKSLPPAGAIVRQAYDQILTPAIEEAIGQNAGLLSKPITFIYRRSLGAGLNILVKRIEKDEKESAKITKSAEDFLKSASQDSEQIQSLLSKALENISRIGGKLRSNLAIPLCILAGLTCIVMIVPVLLAWNWWG